MKNEFAVFYGQTAVGKAEIIRQGLYYRISCRYRLPSNEICRLIIKWPGGWENAGIPVPEGDGFILVKKIPVKKLPDEDMSIHLFPAEADSCGQEQRVDIEADEAATPEETVSEDPGAISVTQEQREQEYFEVHEDQPFDQLDRLDTARTVTVDGQTFISFEAVDSELKQEPDGTMIGAEDICIDGSFEDTVSDPV